MMEGFRMKIAGSTRKGIVGSLLFVIVIFLLSAGVAFGSSEEDSGSVTVIPNWSVLIQIANFIFLIWVLNLILYRPIRSVLIQRKQKISGLEQSIDTFNRDVKEKAEAIETSIKQARGKGLQEKETLLTAAAETEKKMITKINEKAQSDLAEVREKIAKDAVEIRQSLLHEIDEFAAAISQKILGRTVS
jgi:F-type H+-transporting ATPase subunit b